MYGQNNIIRKLSESIVGVENLIMNQRFTFYKYTQRDTQGQFLMPPRGAGFEFLNKNLLHDAVDALGNNILRQAKKLNVNVYKKLEAGCDQIRSNYDIFASCVEANSHDMG